MASKSSAIAVTPHRGKADVLSTAKPYTFRLSSMPTQLGRARRQPLTTRQGSGVNSGAHRYAHAYSHV